MRRFQVYFYYANGDIYIKAVDALSRHDCLRKIDDMIAKRADGIIFGFTHWILHEYKEPEEPCNDNSVKE